MSVTMDQPERPSFGPAESENARVLIGLAIAEDVGSGSDITSDATIPVDATGSAKFVARSPGVVSGLPIVAMLAETLNVGFVAVAHDGDRVEAGSVLARFSGSLRAILKAERIALNFLQRLSGVATLTAKFVDEVQGTSAEILATRKTTPGWRSLEKYAVRCGGGRNHRMGLHDAVLIKDNHLAALAADPDPIGRAIASARSHAPGAKFLEVEVDTLEQFDRALACAADIILLDNLAPPDLAEAVRRKAAAGSKVKLEASGGITLATVGAKARSGVDRISVGALTHSAPALDIGLDWG